GAARPGQRRRPLQRRGRPGDRGVLGKPAARPQPSGADQRGLRHQQRERGGVPVNPWGTVAGAFIGTLVLTTALRAASELKLTRADLPFLLGTAVTVNRTRAKAAGYLLHFVNGQVFAFMYYAVFIAIGQAGWGLGRSSAWCTGCSPAPCWSTSCCHWCILAWAAR